MEEERLEQAGATQHQQQQQQALQAPTEEVVGDRAAVAAAASTTISASPSTSTSSDKSDAAVGPASPVVAIAPAPPHDLVPAGPPLDATESKEAAAVPVMTAEAAKEEKVREFYLFLSSTTLVFHFINSATGETGIDCPRASYFKRSGL